MDFIFKPYAICKEFNWVEIHLWASWRYPAIEEILADPLDSYIKAVCDNLVQEEVRYSTIRREVLLILNELKENS